MPSPVARDQALQYLREAVPYADEIGWRVTADVRFVDCGGNFESVACPRCRTDLGDWWPVAMEVGHSQQFRVLRVLTPCCGLRTSLNRLSYTMAAGFARCVLEAVNPGVGALADSVRARLEQSLGCTVRVIWAHY